MNEHLKQALDIVKAQASIRNMTEEEITSMVQGLSASLRGLSSDGAIEENGGGDAIAPQADLKKTIKERSIVCLECGKGMKILTAKHLAKHGLTPAEYREKWGYPKNMPLVCKALQRERRKKMKDMKLWEKRVKDKA